MFIGSQNVKSTILDEIEKFIVKMVTSGLDLWLVRKPTNLSLESVNQKYKPIG